MFSKEQKQKLKKIQSEGVTILTKSCKFDGKLYCRGSSRISGKVDGSIVSEGLLIIEQSAIVNADIVADEIIVQGKVTGSVKAKARIELSNTTVFKGDIETQNLIISEGAKFDGRTIMLPNLKTQSTNNIPKGLINSTKKTLSPLTKHNDKTPTIKDIAPKEAPKQPELNL